jgi:hypothetical protein
LLENIRKRSNPIASQARRSLSPGFSIWKAGFHLTGNFIHRFANAFVSGIPYRMTADLLESSSDVSRDLAPEWLELSSRVKRLAMAAPPANSALATEALRLCDHFERLHADVEDLLVGLKSDDGPLAGTLAARAHEPSEIDHANLEIQREMHQKSDLIHIVKALFMWKDDPVQRVREKDE